MPYINGGQDTLLANLDRIDSELKKLKLILNGEKSSSNKLSFPVLEKTSKEKFRYGMLEKLQISINKNSKTNKSEFYVIPSLPNVDRHLKEQIDVSWRIASDYIEKIYKKDIPLVEVVKWKNNKII